MGATDPSLVVRVAGNLTELRANMLEGKALIETTSGQLTAMGNAYDGAKTIGQANAAMVALSQLGGAADGAVSSQAALAGVAQLTEAEQAKLNATVSAGIEKYEALGQQAPAAMIAIRDATAHAHEETGKFGEALESAKGSLELFGVGLGAVELIEFGKHLVETGEHIEHSAAVLGVSTDAIQKWTYAIEQSGGSAETLTSAVTIMAKNVENETPKATKSLEALGFSLDDIKAMGMEKAFEAITDKLRDVKDPMLFAAEGANIFGRGFKEMAGAVKEGMTEVGSQANIMSETSVKQLAEAEKAWKSLSNTVVSVSGTALAAVMSTVKEATTSWSGFALSMVDAATGSTNFAGAHAAAKAAADAAAKQLKEEASPAVEKLTDDQRAAQAVTQLMADTTSLLPPAYLAVVEAGLEHGKNLGDIKQALEDAGLKTKGYQSAISDMVEAHKHAVDAQQKLSAELEIYNAAAARAKDAAGEFAGTMSTGEWAKAMLAAHVSLSDVHQLTGLATEDLKKWQTQINETAKVIKTSYDEQLKIVATGLEAQAKAAEEGVKKLGAKYEGLLTTTQKVQDDIVLQAKDAKERQLGELDDKLAREITKLGPVPATYKTAYDKAKDAIHASYQGHLTELDNHMADEIAHLGPVQGHFDQAYENARAIIVTKYGEMKTNLDTRLGDQVKQLGAVPTDYTAAYEDARQAVVLKYGLMKADASDAWEKIEANAHDKNAEIRSHISDTAHHAYVKYQEMVATGDSSEGELEKQWKTFEGAVQTATDKAAKHHEDMTKKIGTDAEGMVTGLIDDALSGKGWKSFEKTVEDGAVKMANDVIASFIKPIEEAFASAIGRMVARWIGLASTVGSGVSGVGGGGAGGVGGAVAGVFTETSGGGGVAIGGEEIAAYGGVGADFAAIGVGGAIVAAGALAFNAFSNWMERHSPHETQILPGGYTWLQSLSAAQGLFDNLRASGVDPFDTSQGQNAFTLYVGAHPDVLGTPYGHGFAQGGLVRPSGLDAGDTVPAWLTPGEGVVTTTGMRMLGAGGLSALNAGTAPMDLGPLSQQLGMIHKLLSDQPRAMKVALREAMVMAR